MLRNLILSDAKRAAEIMQKSFTDERWSESEISSMLADKTFFGYMDEYGFILCRRVYDVIDICTFCVEPKFRKQGRGGRLLASVIDYAVGNFCEIFLEVAENNLSALNLYKSAGFKEISVRKKYYKTESGLIDAILMKFRDELVKI